MQTAWDIGVDDATAVWCFQVYQDHLDIVDYYEGHGQGFDHYCAWLDDRGYHGTDWVPHDAKVREVGSPGARTRIEALVTLGRKPELVPNEGLMKASTPAARRSPSPGSTPSVAPTASRRFDPTAPNGTKRREPSRRRPSTIGLLTARMPGAISRCLGALQCASRNQRRSRSACRCPHLTMDQFMELEDEP